jgi:hypothetical protein
MENKKLDIMKERFWDFCIEYNLTPNDIQELLDWALEKRSKLLVSNGVDKYE